MEMKLKKQEKKWKEKKWRDHDSWTMKLLSAISIELVPMPKRNTHNIHQSLYNTLNGVGESLFPYTQSTVDYNSIP
jgi:N-acetyl-beta-hexosaminidase